MPFAAGSIFYGNCLYGSWRYVTYLAVSADTINSVQYTSRAIESLKVFVEDKGQCVAGSYFENVQGWFTHSERLMVFYDDSNGEDIIFEHVDRRSWLHVVSFDLLMCRIQI